VITEFTIRRGDLIAETYMDMNGCACCLGQYLLACGAENVFGVPSNTAPLDVVFSTHVDGFTVFDLITRNNDAIVRYCDSDEQRTEREATIVAAFGAMGVTATFTGKYACSTSE